MRIPLLLEREHLVVRLDAGLWVIDTGSPSSFGRAAEIHLGGERLEIASTAFGLDANALSDLVGAQLEGLIGNDLLGRFDLLFDLPSKTVEVGMDLPVPKGEIIPLGTFMGVPTLEAATGFDVHRMILDTGAQLSYLREEAVSQFPSAGSVRDFLPMFGAFETETSTVRFEIGQVRIQLRCGRLPGLLGMTLGLAGVEGIIGVDLLREMRVGYFPSRCLLVLLD